MKYLALAAVGAALCATAAAPASAATIAVLQDGTSIVLIDAAAKKVARTVKIQGDAKLVGFDVRPADGRLYGLTQDGTLVVIDPNAGTWTRKSTLSEKLAAGVRYTVDFNPAADRLRVIGSDGTSLRVNVEDGKAIVDGRLKYADADGNKGKTPRVIAGAYSNSVAGTKETTLYDIDAATGALVRQVPPNDGILNTIGLVNVKLRATVALDIKADGKGGNTAWLITGGALYSLDLSSGSAKSIMQVGGLKGATVDLAVLP